MLEPRHQVALARGLNIAMAPTELLKALTDPQRLKRILKRTLQEVQRPRAGQWTAG